jgi:peptidoglycan/LPS O-acetylase OafA/YrhL
MSLVGPRPELAHYVDCYPPRLRSLVLSVAPGLTDWASIHYRDEASLLAQSADPELCYRHTILPAKLEYYVRYVEQRSFLGDVRILGATLQALLLAPLLEQLRAQRRTTRLVWLPDGRLGQDTLLAVLLSLLRGLAALEVAAAHLRAQMFPGLKQLAQPALWYQALAFATGFAHQAVVVFFVLSGWLVGGGLLQRAGQPRALRDYAIDRVTRLWAVLIPAMMLMSCLAAAHGQPQGADYGLGTALGNLLGLQTILVPVYGGDGPLWSLSNESWYYLLFGLVMLAHTARGRPSQLLAWAAVLAALCWLPWSLSLYFTLWLLGAAGAHLRLTAPPAPRMLALLLFAATALLLRRYGRNDDLDSRSILQDLGYGLLLLACLCGVDRQATARRLGARRLKVAAGFLASFSFTLYVLHVPLIGLLWAYRGQVPLSAGDPLSIAVFAAMLAIIVALSYLFYLPFEAQTARLRLRLKGWLGRRTRPAAPTTG